MAKKKIIALTALGLLCGCEDSSESQTYPLAGGAIPQQETYVPPPPPPPPRYEACNEASRSSAQAAVVSYGSQLRDACFFNTVNSYGTIESCQFDNDTGRILARGTFYFTGSANNDNFSVNASVSTLPNGVDPQFSSVVASTNYEAACREKELWAGFLEGMNSSSGAE